MLAPGNPSGVTSTTKEVWSPSRQLFRSVLWFPLRLLPVMYANPRILYTSKVYPSLLLIDNE